MEQYLEIKLANAKELSLKDYNEYRGWKMPADRDSSKEGYLVKYENGHEYWIAKDKFEKSNKKVKEIISTENVKLDYQKRVLDEATELKDKIIKLQGFINNETNFFQTLDADEQTRLKQQLLAMKYYLTILVERIENF